MKKQISINFCDFWGGFDPNENYFINLLREDFEPILSTNPDFLFYSVFGNRHVGFRGKKICYIGENLAPVFRDDEHLMGCDYSFSFDPSDGVRNFRLPHYLLYPEYYSLVEQKVISDSFFQRGFCSFVVSNPGTDKRNEFFRELSKYKKVSSGGRFQNNVGGPVTNKLEFLSNFKFNICFENDAHRGYNSFYTTEKLPQALYSKTIPIYFGNSEIQKEFNQDSFVDLSKFSSVKECIDYIIYLDNSKDKYLEMLRQSPLLGGEIPVDISKEKIKSFLQEIFS